MDQEAVHGRILAGEKPSGSGRLFACELPGAHLYGRRPAKHRRKDEIESPLGLSCA